MSDGLISGEESGDAAKRVSIPILVGVVGKRKDRLAKLGVPEDLVRRKLQAAFDHLQTLTPQSPKLLLCGMADGVDEIAARLVIGTSTERRYANWSVVGLLPMPEQVFVDDFPSGQGQPWWYHTLDDAQRRLVRVIPLQTLSKPGAMPDGSQAAYTAEELRRSPDQLNPVRTAHYEQLAFVLAERSTVFIAVMPQDEVPDRLGGTAQAVAHRLNGWRADWPPGNSVAIAKTSDEFVVPPPLAKTTSGDVWLVPIGAAPGAADGVELRVLRRREETEAPWPGPADAVPRRHAPHAIAQVASLAKNLSRGRTNAVHSDVLIRDGRTFQRNTLASGSGRVARAIEVFNRRATDAKSRKPPSWDDTIQNNVAEPRMWSPVAVAERIRGTLSDLQVAHKHKVRSAAWWLAVFAWISIVCLEGGLEFNNSARELVYLVALLPLAYVVTVGLIIWLLRTARLHAWASVTEDYRMVAEALRVQIAWWQFGLIARKDWVDQHILRYDAREFQLIRQGLACLLESLCLQHAALPAVNLSESLPDGVEYWIGTGEPHLSGQLGYQSKTAHERKKSYEWYESLVWVCFGTAFGMAIWLTFHAWHEAFQFRFLAAAVDIPSARILAWLVPGVLLATSLVAALVIGREHFEGSAEGVTFRRVLYSVFPGILLAAAIVEAGYILHAGTGMLHTILGLGVLLTLAGAGAIKYFSEKIDVEAEAQGAAEASIIYARARRVLDEIDRDRNAKAIDVAEANRRRERVIRDLGLYALAETEAWLRSHRERPLHPPVGS